MWFHSPPHQINERPAELVYRRIQTILELLKNRDPDEPIHTRVQFIKSQLAEYGHNSGTYSTHTRAHAHAHTQIHTHAHTCKPKALTILSVSPLWALACFRKHFYMRLGICWLHVFVQGVFKSTVLAILRPLSAGELRRTPHTYLYPVHYCMT